MKEKLQVFDFFYLFDYFAVFRVLNNGSKKFRKILNIFYVENKNILIQSYAKNIAIEKNRKIGKFQNFTC